MTDRRRQDIFICTLERNRWARRENRERNGGEGRGAHWSIRRVHMRVAVTEREELSSRGKKYPGQETLLYDSRTCIPPAFGQ